MTEPIEIGAQGIVGEVLFPQAWGEELHLKGGMGIDMLDRTHPAPLFTHLTVVADNAKIHQARAIAKWLAAHPRFEFLDLPTYCPRANLIERAFGDVHDKCTRNHTRKRMWHLVQDVKHHLQVNGPWRYTLSDLYYTPEVAAVAALRAIDVCNLNGLGIASWASG